MRGSWGGIEGVERGPPEADLQPLLAAPRAHTHECEQCVCRLAPHVRPRRRRHRRRAARAALIPPRTGRRQAHLGSAQPSSPFNTPLRIRRKKATVNAVAKARETGGQGHWRMGRRTPHATARARARARARVKGTSGQVLSSPHATARSARGTPIAAPSFAFPFSAQHNFRARAAATWHDNRRRERRHDSHHRLRPAQTLHQTRATSRRQAGGAFPRSRPVAPDRAAPDRAAPDRAAPDRAALDRAAPKSSGVRWSELTWPAGAP
eukprot:763418-Prorocentrum_minimum.AAC.4